MAGFYQSVRKVHLELTTRCNAACPQCIRNYHGGRERIFLQDAELTLADIKQIFPESFLRKLELIYINGNYGDGGVARDFLEIVQYFRAAAPNIYLVFITNGSMRTPDWWKKVAGSVHEVFWGIDGLEDTNHIYRRNTNFHRIVENAKAYNDAGGKSHWIYNVFKHNEHQVAQAEALAKELGFFDFQVRKSNRFEQEGYLVDHYPVFNRDDSFAYYLEPPTNPEYINPAYQFLPPSTRKYTVAELIENEREGFEKPQERERSAVYAAEFQNIEVDCKSKNEKEIFVTAGGYVYPCCWLGAYMPKSVQGILQVDELLTKIPGGRESLNARNRPIEAIIEDLFFTRVEESWSKKDPDDGLLVSCARTCGKQRINCYNNMMEK